MTAFAPPPIKEQLAAVALAAICALAFLGAGVRPDRAVLPYPPEVLQPARQEALAGGMAPADLFRGNLSMGDKFNQSLTWDRITRDRLQAGELPLWTRDIGGGVPFVPQMGQVYHPVNLLLLAIPSAGVYGTWYLLHMVLLGFFAYRFMRRIELAHTAALFGMVTLILGFWCQARIHHNVMLSAVLPLFAMLSCTHHLFRHGGGGGHLAMLALGTGMSWICGFAPASLMCTYLVSAYALILVRDCPRGQRLGTLLRFGVAIAVGLAAAAVNLGPILLAAQDTSRGPATVELLAERSLELPHLVTAIWPTLFSWPADHIYLPDGKLHNTWASLAFLDGELRGASFNFPETAFYAGIAPLCLAAVGLRARAGWFFAAAALFGVAMAMGWLLPGSRFLPGAHSGDLRRFLLLFGVCVPVLAAMGLDRLLRGLNRRLPLVLLCVVAVHSVELFLLHLYPDGTLQDCYGWLAERRQGQAPGIFAEWIEDYPGEGAVNRARLLEVFGICSLASLLAATVCWRIGRWTAPVLIAVTLIELVMSGRGTIVPVEASRLTTPPAILQPVLDASAASSNGVRPRLQRLMPAQADMLTTPVPPNMAAFYGVEDLGAYNPLPKRRMEELFLALEPNRDGKVSVAIGGAGVNSFRDPASLSHPLADLLGVEWLLSTVPVEAPGISDRTPSGLASGCWLYHRSTCLPRATFVHRVVVETDRQARLQVLGSSQHDPRTAVVLEDPAAPPPADTPASPAEIEILAHADQVVSIRVRTEAAGYLRLADPYDAGWTATVDGEPVTIYVADHYLRAVFIEAGAHEVVFRYDGPRVIAPQIVSLVALLCILLMIWIFKRRAPTDLKPPEGEFRVVDDLPPSGSGILT